MEIVVQDMAAIHLDVETAVNRSKRKDTMLIRTFCSALMNSGINLSKKVTVKILNPIEKTQLEKKKTCELC